MRRTETACGKLKRNKKYSSVASYKTIYNYIDLRRKSVDENCRSFGGNAAGGLAWGC